jgi:hypothetical protein
MASAMKEPDRSGFCVTRFESGVGKSADYFLVYDACVNSGGNRSQGGFLRCADSGDEAPLGVIGTTAKIRPRHVPKVAGLCHAGKNVDDDELIWTEWPRAALVWIACLIASGDDGGSSGLATLGHHGGFNRKAQTLRRERRTLVDQGAATWTRRAYDLFGYSESDRTESVSFRDGGGFGRRLDFAFGKKRSMRKFETYAQFPKRHIERRGKIVGHAKGANTMCSRQLRDGFSRTYASSWPAFGSTSAPFFERENLIKRAGFLHPSELKRALCGDTLISTAKCDEGIVDIYSAEVELVSARGGVGVKQRRKRRGHRRD